MFVFQITFDFVKSENRQEQLDEVQYLLGAFRMEGRICGREFPLTNNSDRITAFVCAEAEDAFTAPVFNQYIKESFEKSKQIGLSEPQYLNLGRDPASAHACECSEPPAYILFTTYVSLESPLRCASCFGPVPLYRITRPASGDSHTLISRQSDYQACDSLQMNCATGERFGTRQISNYDSSLAKRGLKICSEIEKSMGKAVYYYLYRGSGKSLKAERQRKCPDCGSDWLLPGGWHNIFDFKCDKSRLISNLAWNLR